MRATHYAILLAVAGLTTLPNLGAPALWDMDEGVNAGCAREMFEAGTWVVPTFNWELRVAKPVFLYWLQILAYHAGGVSELTARLPSALATVGTVLVTYELGRRLFDAAVGLLAGVALASAVQTVMLAHAATPDATLVLFTTLTLWVAWRGQEAGGRGWLVWPAVPCGIAVLTKGPVGLAGPGLALLLYFAWNREFGRLLDRRLLWGTALLTLVVAPWVALVAAETRGEWVIRFLRDENLNRAATAQENHSGLPVVYYAVCLLLLFAPWSGVTGVTGWHAVKAARGREPGHDRRPVRFLLCWFVAYFAPFSAAATKLPNYIAPVYPAVALLTAWFLVGWVRGTLTPRRSALGVATGTMLLTGVGVAAGFVVAAGVTGIPIKGLRVFPGLEAWAAVGLIPITAAGVMAWGLVAGDRRRVVTALAAGAVGLVAVAAAGPLLVIDRQKAAKELVFASGACRPADDVRLAAVQYLQDHESTAFYAQRRVEVLLNAAQVRDFLAMPRPGYLFIPEAVWQAEFAGKPDTPACRVAARKYDFYKNAVVVVVATGG